MQLHRLLIWGLPKIGGTSAGGPLKGFHYIGVKRGCITPILGKSPVRRIPITYHVLLSVAPVAHEDHKLYKLSG